MLKLSDTIKRLRHAQGMTQGQLAGLVGVSAPAVSKWEQGASYPDVTLLPALARALHTDLNTLMGFVIMPDRAQVNAMLVQVSDAARAQGIDAGMALAEDMLREYPTCGPLLFGLAATMDGRMMMAGMTGEAREPYAPVIRDWYARAADSDDEEASRAAAHLLASYALSCGEIEEAERMMERLPKDRQLPARWPLDVRLMLAKGDAAGAKTFMQNRFYVCAADVQQMLMQLTQMAVDDGEFDRANALADLAQRYGELLHLHPYMGHAVKLMPALAKKDAAQSAAQIRAMIAALESPWPKEECLLYDRSGLQKSGHAGKDMLAGMLREMEESEECAFLRESEEWETLKTLL